MEEETKLNWSTWLVKGDQYLKGATPKSGTSKFGTDILYNLLSMALESYVMAILDFKQNLPDNHTFTDLMDGLDRVMTIDPNLKEQILKYESIQSICSIDKFSITLPSKEDIDDLRAGINKIKELAYATCPDSAVVE